MKQNRKFDKFGAFKVILAFFSVFLIFFLPVIAIVYSGLDIPTWVGPILKLLVSIALMVYVIKAFLLGRISILSVNHFPFTIARITRKQNPLLFYINVLSYVLLSIFTFLTALSMKVL